MSEQAAVITPEAMERMKEVGHAFGLYSVMCFLSKQRGTRTIEVPQHELAEYTGLTKMTVGRHAKILVKNGLITTQESKTFGGAHKYTLTESFMPEWVIEKLGA